MFAQRAEQTEAMRVAQALAQATRAYLGQQAGLPGGVDPNAVQAYGGETQRQTLLGNQDQRAGAQEGRQAQDHQSKYDFANKFMGALPEQSDPYLKALQLGGGLYGAEDLSSALGGQFGRQGEMQNRTQMNDADNVAAENRLRAELQIRGDADVEKEKRQTGRQDDLLQMQAEAVDSFLKGDPSGMMKLNPQLASNPDFLYQADQNRTRAEAAVKAQKQAEWEAANPPGASPVGSIQESPEALQARLNQLLPGRTPEQMVQTVIKGTEGLGGDYRYKTVRAAYPEMYNQAWTQRQEELKKLQQQEVLEMIQGTKPLPGGLRLGGAQ